MSHSGTFTKLADTLSGIPAAQWNALNHQHDPFLSHEFLIALERNDAVGSTFGWFPQYILAYNDNDELIGAMPMYAKDNSYGELVFDWAWADAYQRNGLRYYPKLVVAIPYTPATGERLLTKNDDPIVRQAMLETALSHCQEGRYSSLHVLFPEEAQIIELESQGLSHRMDVQYHWFNQEYHDFDDFLSRMTSSKRKKIRRERRQVKEAGVELYIRLGSELDEDEWQDVFRFYHSTFDRKYGYATLNLSFFLEELGQTMGERLVIVFARQQGRNIAAAINFCSHDALYGRHWGCDVHIDGLHFETCYYQGIQYAIENGLQRFEPGAQGEHKLARGFEPVLTYSAHWIQHPEFRKVIDKHLVHERRAIKDYQDECKLHTPFKQSNFHNAD
ncbi:MAG: N-acetyltransferase [Gammaproteobacteria bacterium]|nr:MAG: N-acetyltransferase [Gammaproteobacteria bacterium]